MSLRVVFLFVFLSVCLLIDNISGHGRMIDPANRSSLWRVNPVSEPNYNDDQVNCGGKGVQWQELDGKCGVCGDEYDSPHPQDNENTGRYGKGIISKTYTSGSLIDVVIELTANHMGYFNFSICVLQDPSLPETGEDCFKPITLDDGSPGYHLPNTEEIHETISTTLTLKLPDGLTCDRCVLRWHYHTGNDWGLCEDGVTRALGCGGQETFRSCSDITIT